MTQAVNVRAHTDGRVGLMMVTVMVMLMLFMIMLR
jgi:hypothetical protein